MTTSDDLPKTILSPAAEPSFQEDGRGRYREVKMHLDRDTIDRIEQVRVEHGFGGRGAVVDYAVAVALGHEPPDDQRGAGKGAREGVSRWTRYRRARKQADAG